MSAPRGGKFTYFGGVVSSIFFADCCLGMLALFGLTSFVVTLGAWKLDLVSDAVLFPLLGVSILVMIAGYFIRRRAHDSA